MPTEFHFSIAGMKIKLHMLGWRHLGMITNGTETAHIETFDARANRLGKAAEKQNHSLRYSEYQTNHKKKVFIFNQ